MSDPTPAQLGGPVGWLIGKLATPFRWLRRKKKRGKCKWFCRKGGYIPECHKNPSDAHLCTREVKTTCPDYEEE